MITTTDLNEYRGIPAKLEALRNKLAASFSADNDVWLQTLDEIELLKRRRRELRRKGAY